jgi:dihydroorotate dehydrogenase (NAD+) catalytic subunit
MTASMTDKQGVDLTVTLGPVKLKNPVLTASGTYGYGNDIQPAQVMARLGAVCTKGLSLRPREGNPPPRIWETRAGMLNAIGLANMGIEAFLKDVLPELKGGGVTVFANIFSENEEEFDILARMLRGVEGIAAIELNVSCPNVKKGGLLLGKDPQLAAKITGKVASASGLPVFVKLTPEAENLTLVARAVLDGGASGVTAVNTFRGTAIDPATGKPRLSTVFGGLSGPAIKPVAMRMVFELYRDLGLPIIASGGIMTHEDAVEYMMAGASAVEVGTASFADPLAPFKILEGIEEYCRAGGTEPRRLTGLTHRVIEGSG